MLNWPSVVSPSARNRSRWSAERAPGAREVMLDAVERERIVAGGHRRVGGEDRRCAAPPRAPRRTSMPRLDVLVDALQDDERGVAFVQMPDGRRDAERPERADAADAEDDFLLQARLPVAAVETRREVAILRRVLLEAGVEQVQGDAPDRTLPDVGQHRAVAERHRDDAGRPSGLSACSMATSGQFEPLVASCCQPSGGDMSGGSTPADT